MTTPCKKQLKNTILLTAFLPLLLLLSFSDVRADGDYAYRDPNGNTVVLPPRPVILFSNPGILKKDAPRHTPEIENKIRRSGLEHIRVLVVRLPEPITDNQKDPIQKIYVLDKDNLVVGYHQFKTGEQKTEIVLNGIINYVQIYVECANHGLWRKSMRFENAQ